MKKLLVALSILLLTGSLHAQQKKAGVTVLKKMPKNVKEFIKMRNQIAKTPQGGLAMFIAAMVLYGKDENEGMKCLTISIDREWLVRMKKPTPQSYKKWMPSPTSQFIIKQMRDRLYLGGVYIEGTTKEKFYKLRKKGPYKIHYHRLLRNYGGKKDRAKIFVISNGKNRPRPLVLRKNNRGYWKAYEFSSMFVGVIDRPEEEVDDDL